MMNLYSLCFSEEIKNFILQDIFSEKDTSELISDETKQRLLDLTEEDLSVLNESLENVLDLIIGSETKQIIKEKIYSETILVVDDFLLNSKQLSNLVFLSLSLTDSNVLISWPAVKNIIKGG